MRKHIEILLMVNLLNRFDQLGLLDLSSQPSFTGRKAIFENILKKFVPFYHCLRIRGTAVAATQKQIFKN
jgi:hypothetical protein